MATWAKGLERVAIQLEFVKSFAAVSPTVFTVKPAAGGSSVEWTMTGEQNFIAKAFPLAMGGMDKAVRIWDAEGGGRQYDFPDLPQPMYTAALDSEGKIAIAGGRDGVLRVWDVEKKALTQTLTLPAKP